MVKLVKTSPITLVTRTKKNAGGKKEEKKCRKMVLNNAENTEYPARNLVLHTELSIEYLCKKNKIYKV